MHTNVTANPNRSAPRQRRPSRAVVFRWEAEFWKVAEIAQGMRWDVQLTRRRLQRARVVYKDGRHWMTSRDRLRAGWPELLDALHRRSALGDEDES